MKFNLMNFCTAAISGCILFASIHFIWSGIVGGNLPNKIHKQISNVDAALKVATWKDLGDLKSKLDKAIDLDRQIDEVQRELANAPGPEPSWWELWDHYWWAKRKETFDNANNKLERLQTAKNQIIEDTKGLASDPKRIMEVIDSISPLRLFWNETVAPFMHFLLGIALLKFTSGFLLRSILINGLVKPTRLCKS